MKYEQTVSIEIGHLDELPDDIRIYLEDLVLDEIDLFLASDCSVCIGGNVGDGMRPVRFFMLKDLCVEFLKSTSDSRTEELKSHSNAERTQLIDALSECIEILKTGK